MRPQYEPDRYGYTRHVARCLYCLKLIPSQHEPTGFEVCEDCRPKGEDNEIV